MNTLIRLGAVEVIFLTVEVVLMTQMIQTTIYVIEKFVSYVVELLSKDEAWLACGCPTRNIWKKDLP